MHRKSLTSFCGSAIVRLQTNDAKRIQTRLSNKQPRHLKHSELKWVV